jgi:hypothetical protein
MLPDRFEWVLEKRPHSERVTLEPLYPDMTRFELFSSPIDPTLIDFKALKPVPIQPGYEIDATELVLTLAFQTLDRGGSVLMGAEDYESRLNRAQTYPELLFTQLDKDWDQYARSVREDRFGLLVPPVLAIVLSRCARRSAIPSVLIDLRNEWSFARERVWALLDELRMCHTLNEAEKIRKGLSDATKLFSPAESEIDSRPIRIFWDLFAGTAAGTAIAALAGGKPLLGAATGLLGGLANSALPCLAAEPLIWPDM